MNNALMVDSFVQLTYPDFSLKVEILTLPDHLS